MDTVKLYVVQYGDSVAGIAGKHHMSVPEFRALNDGIVDERLVQGMKVRVSAAVQPLKVQRSEKIKQQAPAAAAPVTEVKAPQAQQAEKPQVPNAQTGAAEAKQPVQQSPASLEHAGEYNTIFYPAANHFPNQQGAANPPQPQPYGPQLYSPAASVPQWPQGYPAAPPMPQPQMNPYAGYPGNPTAPAQVNHPNMPGYYAPASMQPVHHYFPQAPGYANPYAAYSPAQMAPAPAAPPVNPPSAVSPVQKPVSAAAGPNPAAIASTAQTPAKKIEKKIESAAKPAAKKNAYPFLPAGTININQPVSPSASFPSPQSAPWQQPAVPPAVYPPAPIAPVNPASKAGFPGMKPNIANKGNAAAPGGKVGGYPQPFMPVKQQPGKPCGCGGPSPYSFPYSPFGPGPQIGYYGGNRPPEEIPYSALSPATPPVYKPAGKKGPAGNQPPG